jgi:hypothetical protein
MDFSELFIDLVMRNRKMIGPFIKEPFCNYGVMKEILQSWSTSHMMAVFGYLPDGFQDWSEQTGDGWTVAHVALKSRTLPADFKDWRLANRDGVSVAHMAASLGLLPAGFECWANADERGWTVAHEAAKNGTLPENFPRMDLEDNEGVTVEQVYCSRYYGKGYKNDPSYLARMARLAQGN